ncbi:MAG: YqgE/AlgH family protein [Pirellulaceae bacterium]|nr:YqgE/AlgH family protein [Pirellulaceae bacterium]
MEYHQGKALVASPYLTDGNFMRTVVYLLTHDKHGAAGVILNRPLNLTVGELLGDVIKAARNNTDPVFCGGPVDGQVLMLQAMIGKADQDKFVFSTAERGSIADVVQQPSSAACPFRIFDGYSGWGTGQLESEMAEGSWLVWDAPADVLFGASEELWETAIRHIGRKIISTSLVGTQISADPSTN